MTLRVYLVWDTDNGDETTARAVKAHNPDQAAEEYVRRRWSHNDYPDEMNVNVRAPRGDMTGWKVFAERDVTFRAVSEKP